MDEDEEYVEENSEVIRNTRTNGKTANRRSRINEVNEVYYGKSIPLELRSGLRSTAASEVSACLIRIGFGTDLAWL